VPRVVAAFYELDGELAVPAELTRGPWDPRSQHGGAPAALLAREVEQAGADGMRTARMTVEFLAPVPIEPLRLSARVPRPGRRVELVEAELWHAGKPVVRATALRIREAGDPLPAVADPAPAPPGHEGATPVQTDLPIPRPWFGEDAVEVRFAAGALMEPGPATAWFRLRVPVVEGEEPTPFQRAACAADFGNGVSSALDWTKYVFVNPDLTLYLERPPRGEWVCLDARTTVDPGGTGLARSTVHDEHGPIGSATQALFVAPR
jgi:Acyl-CoA thioesterase C-terminal domain/Acyl-CoA thioesterase N-terminal domain